MKKDEDFFFSMYHEIFSYFSQLTKGTRNRFEILKSSFALTISNEGISEYSLCTKKGNNNFST